MARAKRKQIEVNFYTYDQIKNVYNLMIEGIQIPSEYLFMLENDIDFIQDFVEEYFLVETKSGKMVFGDSSYLVVGDYSEIYPCEKHLFYEIYDEVI